MCVHMSVETRASCIVFEFIDVCGKFWILNVINLCLHMLLIEFPVRFKFIRCLSWEMWFSLMMKAQPVPSGSICQCDLNAFQLARGCAAAAAVTLLHIAGEALPSLGQPDCACAVTVSRARCWEVLLQLSRSLGTAWACTRELYHGMVWGWHGVYSQRGKGNPLWRKGRIFPCSCWQWGWNKCCSSLWGGWERGSNGRGR